MKIIKAKSNNKLPVQGKAEYLMYMIAVLFASVMTISSCQHVRVQTAPEYPESCGIDDSGARERCDQALKEQKEEILASDRVTTHTIKQSFWLMGFYPFEQRINLNDYCQGQSLLEAYQYFTWQQGLYENILTLGIWSPRTLVIKCVKPKPKPRRRVF